LPPILIYKDNVNGSLTISTASVPSTVYGVDWSISGSRRNTVSRPIVIAEESEGLTIESAETLTMQVKQVANPDHISPDGVDKENTLPGGGKPQKYKKRKSIGQQSNRQKQRFSGNAPSTATDDTENVALVMGIQEDDRVDDQGMELNDQAEAAIDSDASASKTPAGAAEPSPPVKRKRKKRKSVVLVRKKRRSSSSIAQGTNGPLRLMTPASSREDQQADSHDTLEDSASASISEDDIRPGSRQRRSTAHRQRTPPRPDIYQSSPVRMPPEADENEDDTYVDDESPEPPTPAITTKSRKRRSNDSILPSIEKGHRHDSHKFRLREVTQPKPKKTMPTFPILTHRLTNTGALPIIVEEAEDQLDSDDDLNLANTSFLDRAAPNAVDVLAQICRETVDSAISRMEASTNSAAGRAEAKRKRTALEAFGSELDSRLFDLSATVEHRLTLEARVRKSKREKADLQTRWVEVRQQREETALKCDAVRRKHWKNEAKGKERHEMSEQLHTLEMVMEREKDEVEEGLEFMLRSVAGRVSSADGGGLLERVKEFNRHLERTAAVLEGRLV
jgi:hypothetical protein